MLHHEAKIQLLKYEHFLMKMAIEEKLDKHEAEIQRLENDIMKLRFVLFELMNEFTKA